MLQQVFNKENDSIKLKHTIPFTFISTRVLTIHETNVKL